MKVLIEGVIQVPPGQSLCLTIAGYLANLMSGHKNLSILPLLALTCTTTELSADLLVILSTFGLLPTTFVSLPSSPHNDEEPQRTCSIAGQRSGPPFFGSLLEDLSSEHFASRDPLRLVPDSLRGASFECSSAGLFYEFALKNISPFHISSLFRPDTT